MSFLIHISLQPIKLFQLALLPEFEPRSYPDAIKYQRWRDAMNSEIKALQDNNTPDMTSLPPNQKAIGSKWIFASNTALMVP